MNEVKELTLFQAHLLVEKLPNIERVMGGSTTSSFSNPAAIRQAARLARTKGIL